MKHINHQGLIIGLCGRLGSGKKEIAQLICQNSKLECKSVFLDGTLNITEFLTVMLEEMEKEKFSLDLTTYSELQLEQLEQFIKSIHKCCFEIAGSMVTLADSLMFESSHQILYPITNDAEILLLNQRNYFHLIAVDTPIQKRYENFKKKYHFNISQQLFCVIDDVISEGIVDLMFKAKVRLQNDGDQKDLLIRFYQQYQEIFRPIRPNWNQYFMHIANVVKQRSNCMKRAVGAVLVKNDRIIATGYNGTPNGKLNCCENGCDRCNQNTGQGKDLEKCFCFHAEESAILEIGIKKSKGVIMYTTLFPCLQCTKIILSTKIERIYYEEDYDNSAAISELHKYCKVEQIDTSNYVF